MAGRKRWLAVSAAVAAALATSHRAKAANYFWEGDNNNAWNTNSGFLGSNWSTQLAVNLDPQILPGAADDIFFSGLGAPAGTVNSTLGQDFSIRSLTYLASNTDSVNISGPGTLTIGAGGISIFGGPNSTNQMNANVALSADQTWSNNVAGFSYNVGGKISGANTLSLGGAGSFNLTAANSLSGGVVLTTAGVLVSVNDGAGSMTNISSLTLNNGAIFNLNSSVANHATQNRLADNLTVASGGGSFNMLGNSSVATTETVGTLQLFTPQLGTGATQVNATGAAGSTLTFGSASIASITRMVGSTVNFNSDPGTFIKLPNVTQTNGIIGAHATVGSITGGFGAAVDWATLDASKNVVPFTNYQTSLSAATATDNVQINNLTALNAGTTTINSLYLTGSGGITYPGGTGNTDTLIIGSGGIISNGATPTATVNGNTNQQNTVIIGNQVGDVNGLTHGFITAANGELIITAANGSGVRVASVIKDNGATPVNLTISGNGLVDLGNGNAQANKTVNTYSGITTVNGGATLIVNNELNFGAIPPAFRANEITLNGGILVTTAGFAFDSKRGITVGAAGGTLRYTGGSTWTLAAPITGAGGVTFSSLPTSTAGGANTVVVNQAAGKNTYLGPTVFEVGKNPFTANFGHVQLGNNDEIPHNSALTVNQFDGSGQIDFNGKSLTIGSLAGNAPIINHNSTLTIGQNGLSTVYSGVMAGSGTVTKVGSGVQTFSGVNTYSGATTVNGGTLLITSSPTGTGLITVNAGGTLGGNGTLAAPVTVANGGALAPAINANTPSILNINNSLTLANGASLNFLFGSLGLNDMVSVNGAGKTLTLSSGVGSDVLNINDLPGFGLGTYTLLQTTGGAVLNDTANFVINGNTQFNYAVSATNGPNGAVVLNVTPGNPTLVWSGAANSNWDKGSVNWQGGNGIWADGDNAIFDSTGSAHPNVAVLAGGVNPNTMLFNNATNNYTFTGGPIAITGSLTKNLSGSVTFNDVVSAGLVKITGGSVTVGATGALNSSSVTVATGASLSVAGSMLSTTALQTDGTTTFTNATQTLASLSGSGNGIVNLNGPTTLTIAGGVFGGAINGTGGLVINSPTGQSFSLGGINYTGTTQILNGGLITTGGIGAGAAIQVGDIAGSNSASLLTGGPVTIARDVLVAAGNTGVNTLGGNSADASTFSGKVTLANINAPMQFTAALGGTVNFTGNILGAGAVNVVGPGATVFSGPSIAYTGPTTVNGGSLSVNSASLTSSVTVAGGGVYNANAPGSAGNGPIAINASTISPGNGNTYNGAPGVFNANSPNLLGGASLTVNGGVLGIAAGNTIPITSVSADNNSTVNLSATTPVIFANATSLKVPNSTLAFSAASAAPSSVTVKMTTADHVAGTFTNLSLNNSVVQAKAGSIANLSDFNLNVTPSVYSAGLREGLLSNPASDVNLNSASLVSRMEPIQKSAVQANVTTNWPLNSTYTYSGQIMVNNTNGDGTGTIGFAESFDDSVQVIIDGVNVLNNEVYNVTTGGTAKLSAGWHNIEMRFGQGVGGVGPVTDETNGWGPAGTNGAVTNLLGFGYAANGTSGLSGANYIIPVETGTTGANATLFRTAISGGALLTIDDGATMLLGSVSGGENPAVSFGSGTNGSILAFSAKTAPVNSNLGVLAPLAGSTSTLDVRANNVVTVQNLNVAGTLTTMGVGNLIITNPINVSGTLNVAANLSAPSFNVAGPATNTSALLNFASGVSYSNAVNVNGAGLVTISGTTTAMANLITGPINLSKTGGLVLMVAQQPTGSPVNVNVYNGRVNVLGGTADASADGVIQVRNSGTNAVIAVGLFTNVHLADNSGLNFGLAPGAANPRDQIVMDLTLDGTRGFLSSNADGGSPEFIRNISGTNPGTLLTVFPISGTNVPNINSVNGTAFTAVGAKSINFVGSLNPNIHVLNSEGPAAGINLTSNANVTGVGTTNIASFLLNGGTFETGTFGANSGTTNLLAAAASPGTSGTFLVTGAGTFNVNRSADATITYQSGALNILSDQTLTGFNIGDGVNGVSYSTPAFNITTGTMNVLANASVSVNAGTLTAGPTRVDGTLNIAGANLTTTGLLSGTGMVNVVFDPGLVTGDASSGSFDGTLSGNGSIIKQGAGVWTVAGDNTTYFGPITVNAGTLKVTSSVAASSGVTVNNGFFEAGSSQVVTSLTLANTGNAKITASAHAATPKVLTVNNLTVTGATSSIDVTNNAMIIKNSTPASVRAMLISGRGNNTWNGPGIDSSSAALTPSNRAVGYADASSLLNIAPGGNAPWLDNQIASSGDVLVRYTVSGDSNLDGKVDFTDLVALAQHYGQNTGGVWQTGDFDYDGAVGFADLVSIAQNYNAALPAEAIPGAPVNFSNDLASAFASVPEPGSLALVAAAMGLLSKRVRRKKATA